jgi:hypothetical protein
MQQKEAYWKMRQKIAEGLGDQIDDFQKEKGKSEIQNSSELNEVFLTLKQKREGALEKLNELIEASEDAWESLKEGVDKALDDLKSAVDEALSKVK